MRGIVRWGVRTTLTIDDRVLAAARARARQRGISVGLALSELAAKGYEVEMSTAPSPAGFPMLPEVEDHVITVEMVDDALDDE
jgi:hypothetical protein